MPTELTRKVFYLTEEESADIEQRAKNVKMSVSNYTRELYGLKPLERGVARATEKKKKEKPKS